jgi:dCMP deaminase
LADKESELSSDWWRQIGAVFVKEGKVLYKAHNHHLPSDFHLGTFGDPRSNFDKGEKPEIYTSIHSEANIVAMGAKEGVSLKGGSIYVTTFPCSNCARLLCEAGVKKVFYKNGYSRLDAENIFKSYGVEIVLVK